MFEPLRRILTAPTDKVALEPSSRTRVRMARYATQCASPSVLLQSAPRGLELFLGEEAPEFRL